MKTAAPTSPTLPPAKTPLPKAFEMSLCYKVLEERARSPLGSTEGSSSPPALERVQCRWGCTRTFKSAKGEDEHFRLYCHERPGAPKTPPKKGRPPKTHECLLCHITKKRKRDLDLHQASKHNVGMGRAAAAKAGRWCKVCGKAWTSKWSLKRHMAAHRGHPLPTLAPKKAKNPKNPKTPTSTPKPPKPKVYAFGQKGTYQEIKLAQDNLFKEMRQCANKNSKICISTRLDRPVFPFFILRALEKEGVVNLNIRESWEVAAGLLAPLGYGQDDLQAMSGFSPTRFGVVCGLTKEEKREFWETRLPYFAWERLSAALKNPPPTLKNEFTLK